MTTRDCPAAERPRARVAHLAVRDVMIAAPTPLPAGATVGQVRALLRNARVESVLLVDGAAYAGSIERAAVPAAAADEAPARPYASRAHATVRPDEPVSRALELLDAAGGRRLVVLDDDGSTLRGLLCLDPAGAGFCGDRP
jgi:CBS domain-containing protein